MAETVDRKMVLMPIELQAKHWLGGPRCQYAHLVKKTPLQCVLPADHHQSNHMFHDKRGDYWAVPV